MRDFAKTPEPAGDGREESSRSRFVIQEHHATALHWDLRLERNGVLVSFAVPMGIPPDPKENRLAVHTEDHPLEYLEFEGHIPDGNYGAGDMFVWDRGTYETHKFRDKEIMVTFHGGKVRGKYVLFPTNEKDWMIHRMDPPEDTGREPMPATITPMLALPSQRVPSRDEDYGFEVKWDGIRAIVFVKGGRVRIQSRNLLDITAQYPELRELGESLGATEAILDGEIVAINAGGRPDFGLLQRRMGVTRPNDARRRMKDTPAHYFLFDLLYLNGHSTMELTYRERRKLLDSLELEGPNWRTPPYHVGDGEQMRESARAQGLEGVVAKRLDSPYYPGRRNNCWLKIKNNLSEEFVVGGWTAGEGNRSNSIGALLLGYYDTDDNSEALAYVGKVGTGFSQKFLAELQPVLARLASEKSPFVRGAKLPAGARFVRPELVAEVDFTEFTHDGIVRHPSFHRLRPDRKAKEIRRGEAVEMGDDSNREDSNREAPAQSPDANTSANEDLPGIAVAMPTGRRVAKGKTEVVIDRRTLQLSNLEKVLYPATGFTKAQIIDYYVRIAPVLLPHARNRPMTLKRYPDGVDSQFFFEKRCPPHAPEWVQTAPIWTGSTSKTVNFVLVNDLATLAWVANLASIELHPQLYRAPESERPDVMVFDLDPGPPADLVNCAQVALWLRELFEALGLHAFPKTSGSKGMQIYVPLNTAATFDQTKSFALAMAQLLEKQHPEAVTSNMNKALRTNKVFIDWSQNDRHKTTVLVYSLRAREHPTVSTPLRWEEVEHIAATGEAAAFRFEAPAVLERVEKIGDLFAPVLELKQELPSFAAAG